MSTYWNFQLRYKKISTFDTNGQKNLVWFLLKEKYNKSRLLCRRRTGEGVGQLAIVDERGKDHSRYWCIDAVKNEYGDHIKYSEY